jgi:hypothetical protein
MVGSDDEKFKDLAKETKLPEKRQDTCAGSKSCHLDIDLRA